MGTRPHSEPAPSQATSPPINLTTSNWSPEASDEEDHDAVIAFAHADIEALGRDKSTWSSWSSLVPRRLQTAWLATARWVQGPVPPRPWSITPFFPRFQTAPVRLLDKWLPRRRQKALALGAFCFCWFLVCFIVLHQKPVSDDVERYGEPRRLACEDSFWVPKNHCGMNGLGCRPFSDELISFRCPATCAMSQVWEPHAVGTYEAEYEPLVIGGPPQAGSPIDSAVYRGDSFICSAAIHAGLLKDSQGGCGVLRKIGQHSNFTSVSAHGITSIPFDSYFPLAFTFLPATVSGCSDLRWALTGVSVAFTVLLSLFTASPPVFYWTLFTGLYLHVAFVSEPPNAPNYYKLFSITTGTFLPAAFIAAAIYTTTVRPTLLHLRAHVEKTLLWLGGLWVGALNNYTFDRLPLRRLTPHDIAHEPGALPTLISIVLALVLIAGGQAWSLRIAGLLPRYLALYAALAAGLLFILALPGESLRIHHYILALLLLPGTALQTRPSLLYQGLLVGLFVNGLARWGFAPLVETPADLVGGGVKGSALPVVHAPRVDGGRIAFTWDAVAEGYDGVSVLVNDVERYRGYVEDGGAGNWTWNRHKEGEPEYFRFGYMQGNDAQDYTKAGKWRADGEWEKMKPGASR